MKKLTLNKDGVNAISLGVMGESEYALDFANDSAIACNIWRRSANQENTYGGWRFEFASNHPHAFKTLPYMVELAARVDAAIAERKEQVDFRCDFCQGYDIYLTLPDGTPDRTTCRHTGM